MAEKNQLFKKGAARFTLVGKAKISANAFSKQTFKSGWQSQSMAIGVDCGQGNVIYSELEGGCWEEGNAKSTKFYCHGYSNDNKYESDYSNSISIAFEDRFDNEIIDRLAYDNFINIYLEKDKEDKYFCKRFLSGYDASEYVKEHIKDGDYIKVTGSLVYETDGEKVYVKKKITSLRIANEEFEKPTSNFVQTVYLDEYSIGKKTEKNTLSCNVFAVDYVSGVKVNGKKVDVKKNLLFPVNMEIDLSKNPETAAKMVSKFFKAKSGQVIKMDIEGTLSECAETVSVDVNDYPDDIKFLVETGIIDKESLETQAISNSKRERRMIITKPFIKNVDGKPVIVRDDKTYKPENLEIATVTVKKIQEANDMTDSNTGNEEYTDFVEIPTGTSDKSGDDDFLNLLGDFS